MHPARHSRRVAERLTLELLWFLRELLMRRTFYILLFLAVLVGTAAHGSPKHPAKSRKSGVAVTSSSKKKPQSPAAHAGKQVAAHASKQAATHAGKQVETRASKQAAKRAPASKRAAVAPVLAPASRRRANSRLANSRPSVAPQKPVFRETRRSRQAADRRALLKPASLESRPVFAPSLLRGSYESMVRQNEKTEADGLARIEDDNDLLNRIVQKELVPLPASASLVVNSDLPENRRYCRPWSATFLTDMAKAHALQFHRPIEVSSAVRTVAYQKQLRHINGNAAAAEGDIASPHLTGASIDIAKSNLSQQELSWIRAWLLPLQQAGKIDVAEEFKQACFHITVYKSYLPPPVTTTNQTATQPTGSNGKDQGKQHRCLYFFQCE